MASATATKPLSHWEELSNLASTLTGYAPLDLATINREHTISLRRGFNAMAQVFDSFIDKEREYLNFLTKRSKVSPRCYFIKAHQMEVDADMVQLHKMKIRMMECRDKVLVVGNQENVCDIHFANVYMPTSSDEIDSMELSMALYGNL